VTKMKRAIEGRMLVVIMLLAVALAAQLQGVWGQTTGTDIEIGEGSNTCKVPFGEPCPDGQPGVRCFRDPCDNSFAKCPGHPDALCGSFYCQSPVMYRGQSIGRGCQPTFFSPATCSVIESCSEVPADAEGSRSGPVPEMCRE